MSITQEQREAARRRPNYVYRLYSHGGTLLYIGRTSNLEGRWRDHRTTKPWARRVSHYRLMGPFTHGDAVQVEKQLQADENPLYGSTSNKIRAIAEGIRMNVHEAWNTKSLPATSIDPREVSSLNPIGRVA